MRQHLLLLSTWRAEAEPKAIDEVAEPAVRLGVAVAVVWPRRLVPQR